MWDRVIDTQKHFNEMSVKSRQLGLTFVVAAIGLAVVLISRGEGFGVKIPGGWFIHVGSLVVLIAAFAVFAVRKLDLNVYHQMLRGAVAFGEKIEIELREKGLFEAPKGMTQSISLYSRYTDVDEEKLEPKNNAKRKSALDKIILFYRFVFWLLIAIAIIIAFAYRNFEPKTKITIAEPFISQPHNTQIFSPTHEPKSDASKASTKPASKKTGE